ncbi:hypothetical protein C6568_06825 [Melaminivora suipulveris]|uniref:Hemerythrin-like domain-containing protein n=1 Tax=Melaminivora suipulveris TaxID=2109913 RepID=A0A2R3QB27_9BURK|nr:hypothetical protein C6568_06825 [Melaminivora suipulveris]
MTGGGSAARVSLPGVRAPGAGFDEPFAMLDACHERVRRSLDLLERLRAYLPDKGCDDSARQAARDVLRYFDIAAPLRHEDLTIYPAARAVLDQEKERAMGAEMAQRRGAGSALSKT